MNESLSQMVKESNPNEVIFSEENLDLPTEEETDNTEVQEATQEEAQSSNSVPISELSSWFETNSEGLENINQVKVSIRGVDSEKTLIMAVKDGDATDNDGNAKRLLRVFDNADLIPVLNLPPVRMDVYNNGFRIINQYNDTVFIKSYGVKAGLICTLCVLVNDKLIPYQIVKIKRKETDLQVSEPGDVTALQQKLTGPANTEALQLLYKQSSKAVESMTTTQSAVDWLIDRQESVTDINHHLQIDNVLIDILK